MVTLGSLPHTSWYGMVLYSVLAQVVIYISTSVFFCKIGGLAEGTFCSSTVISSIILCLFLLFFLLYYLVLYFLLLVLYHSSFDLFLLSYLIFILSFFVLSLISLSYSSLIFSINLSSSYCIAISYSLLFLFFLPPLPILNTIFLPIFW